jgi:hypothetical protein
MVSAGIHACLGRVRLEALGQILRTAEGRGVPAVDLVRGDPQALSGHVADERSGEQAVIAAEQHPRGTSGHAARGDGSPIRASDCLRLRFNASDASSGGTSW